MNLWKVLRKDLSPEIGDTVFITFRPDVAMRAVVKEIRRHDYYVVTFTDGVSSIYPRRRIITSLKGGWRESS
jgi:hypothetical protein